MITRIRRVPSWAGRHPEAAIALVGLLVVAGNLMVIHRDRNLGAFDIDEAGYLADAFRARRAFEYGGVPELWRTLPDETGPLVPVLSVPALLLRPRSLVAAMVVQPLLHLCSAIGVTGIVRRTATSGAALAAGVVVLGFPASMVAARTYKFAGAAACFLVLAVWAMLCSDGFRRVLPSVGLGAASGAMLLARTMTIAFLPALALGALLLVTWERRAIRNLALGVVVALLVSGPWWFANWGPATRYLGRSGYGEVAGQFGPEAPFDRVGFRAGSLMISVRPLLLLSLIVLLVLAMRELIGPRHRPSSILVWLRAAPQRPLVAVWAIVIAGYASLLSSANVGTWFDLPLLLLAIAGLAAGASHLPAGPRQLVAGLAVGAAVLNIVLVGNVRVGETIRYQSGSRPVPASFFLFAGAEGERGALVEADGRFLWGLDTSEIAEGEWWAANRQLAGELEELDARRGPTTRVVVGSSSLLSANSLLLAEELQNLRFAPLEEYDEHREVGSFLDRLERDDYNELVAVVIDARSRTSAEAREREDAIRGIEELGWDVAADIALPDGGQVTIYTRPAT